jgi:hypothetical protein
MPACRQAAFVVYERTVQHGRRRHALLSARAVGVGLRLVRLHRHAQTDVSSCSFLLPSFSTLSCVATAGTVCFTGSRAIPLGAGAYAKKTALPKPCPTASFPGTSDCDCGFTNPSTSTDAIVTIVAESVDDGFNSFHCYVDGANVCGWGSNEGMNSSTGSCSFVLPAGEAYDCAMEWGATSFVATSAVATLRSIFPPSASDRRRGGGSGGGRILRSAGAFPSAAAGVDFEVRIRSMWASWRSEHGVTYASEEEESRRFLNFREHIHFADENAWRVSAHPSLDGAGRVTRANRFADMSIQEWRSAFRGRAAASAAAERGRRKGSESLSGSAAIVSAFPSPSPPPAPPVFDWRTHGVVTAVKDQGQCGSCWSFSTTGCVESAWAVAGNTLVSLSEQQLVSCDGASEGCDGGYPFSAIDWIAANGSDTEESYPYVSGDGTTRQCNTSSAHVLSAVNVSGFYVVPTNASAGTGEDAMADWTAAYSPLSILVDAMTQLWWPYIGGVMTGCCDTAVDHAVLLVGFNASDSAQRWFAIKNSWSEQWGEGGYLRLLRGENECGLTTQPIVASVAGGLLPPPPPSPPPRPVWQCPDDATSVNTSSLASCVWKNNTVGMVMPPTPSEYCDYISDGYEGYVWPVSEGTQNYPCAPSFHASNNGGTDFFCVLTQTFPANATAICGDFSGGIIGYAWPL